MQGRQLLWIFSDKSCSSACRALVATGGARQTKKQVLRMTNTLHDYLPFENRNFRKIKQWTFLRGSQDHVYRVTVRSHYDHGSNRSNSNFCAKSRLLELYFGQFVLPWSSQYILIINEPQPTRQTPHPSVCFSLLDVRGNYIYKVCGQSTHCWRPESRV